MNTFQFIGHPMLPKDVTKFYTEYPDAKQPSHKINFMVKASDNNAGFVSVIGAQQEKLNMPSKDSKNRLEIKWKDRFNDKYIQLVPTYALYRTNLGCQDRDVKQFLSPYDFVAYLNAELPKLSKDDVIRVTGRFKLSPYKDTILKNFDIQAIWKHTVKEDDPKTKMGLTLSLELFYDKNALDTSDNDKYILNAFLNEYINKDLKNRYIPIVVQFDAGKFDKTNTKHVKLLNSRLNYMQKNVGNNFASMMWDCIYIRGAEEVDFDESMLTDAQREQIELGEKTIDDFRGKVFGNNTEIIKLKSPNLAVAKYKDGLVDTNLSFEDIQSLTYSASSTPNTNQKPDENDSDSNDEDDIDDILN